MEWTSFVTQPTCRLAWPGNVLSMIFPKQQNSGIHSLLVCIVLGILATGSGASSLVLERESQNSLSAVFAVHFTADSGTNIVKCGKDGSKLFDLTTGKHNDAKCSTDCELLSSSENKIRFKVDSPECGKSVTIWCQLTNGDEHDEDHLLFASPDLPVIRVNDQKPVFPGEPVKVQCTVNRMCGQWNIEMEPHYDYHLTKPRVSYQVENDGRLAATAVASVMFPKAGEYNFTCKAQDTAIPLLNKPGNITCRVHHSDSGEYYYKCNQHKHQSRQEILRCVKGQHSPSCKAVYNEMSSTKKVSVQKIQDREPPKPEQQTAEVGRAVATQHSWTVIMGLVIFQLFNR